MPDLPCPAHVHSASSAGSHSLPPLPQPLPPTPSPHAAQSGQGHGGSSSSPSGSSGAASGGGGGGGRKLANDFKESAQKTQPNALDTLAPSPGVTLRSGGSTKLGPRRTVATGAMTREEFARYAARTARRGGPDSAGTGAGTGGLGTPSTASSVLPGRLAAPISQSQSQAVNNGEGGGTPSAPPAGRDPIPNQLSVAFVEDDGGSAEAPALPSVLDRLPDAPPITAGALRRAPPVPPKPPTPDIHGAVVAAPDWGRAGGAGRPQVGAPLPVAKPDARMTAQEVGRTVRLPRERASQYTGAPPLSPSKAVPGAAASRS